MKNQEIKTNFDRNNYGEIEFSAFATAPENYLRDLQKEAFCLIADAAKKKKIPMDYNLIERDYKKGTFEGDATAHELYDVSKDGRHCLVCVRNTEGNKYGVRTTSKNYFLISAHGKTGVKVRTASKGKAAKAAKQAKNPGDAIAVCLGKKKLKSALTQEKITGYKIVKNTDSGYMSVYDDDVAWDLGKTKKEKATPDHTGGFYVFDSAEQAVKTWAENNVFFDHLIQENGNFALLECECQGRRYRHDNEKICISSVKPMRVVASFIK